MPGLVHERRARCNKGHRPAAGFRPVMDRPKREPWRSIGVIFEVERDGQIFILSVSHSSQEIGLQEVRADRYDFIE